MRTGRGVRRSRLRALEALPIHTLTQLVAAQLLLYAAGWGICGLMLRQERSATLHWSVFCVLSACGLGLVGTRDETRGWSAYVGSVFLFALSFAALWRGVERFAGTPPREAERLLMLAAVIAATAAAGPGEQHAALRVAVSYLGNGMLITFTLLRLWPAARAEFGLTPSSVVLAPALLMTALFVGRGVQQVAHPDVILEMHLQNRSNVEMLFGYLVGAALFNFTFLALLIMRLLKRLRELTQRDPLTGLLNRRAFDLALESGWLRHRRQRMPLALLAMDLDHFKRVNDTHGHAVGDSVLMQAAHALRSAARQDDVVARLGGEEFVLVVAGIDEAATLAMAQRLRQSVAEMTVEAQGRPVQVTISIGIAFAGPRDADGLSLLQRADAALYRAKETGRDRVVIDEDAAAAEAPSPGPHPADAGRSAVA